MNELNLIPAKNFWLKNSMISRLIGDMEWSGNLRCRAKKDEICRHQRLFAATSINDPEESEKRPTDRMTHQHTNASLE